MESAHESQPNPGITQIESDATELIEQLNAVKHENTYDDFCRAWNNLLSFEMQLKEITGSEKQKDVLAYKLHFVRKNIERSVRLLGPTEFLQFLDFTAEHYLKMGFDQKRVAQDVLLHAHHLVQSIRSQGKNIPPETIQALSNLEKVYGSM